MKTTLSRYRLRNTLVAGALAFAGALLVFLYVVSYRSDVQSGAGLVEVFVAARDIPEGLDGASAAGDGYLEKQSVLRRNVVSGAISSPGQISSLAASQTILAGEQVTLRQFHSAAEEGVLASISGNRRAMTISGTSEQLLAGIVRDGDRVDVLAFVEYSVRPPAGSAIAGADLRRVASRVILRDLLVLRAPAGADGGGLDGADTRRVTIALTDFQAQKLLFAVQNGVWWLVLRPVAKPTDSPESVETIQSLLGDGLGDRGVNQLTDGYGSQSVGSGR
jgi:Flp pilus assembly protein CpaB